MRFKYLPPLATFLFFGLYLMPLHTYSQQQEFIKGADGSVLDQVEQSGGIFYENGEEKDACAIFKNNDINNIRLKLWHTPAEPYNNLERVLVMSKRAKDLGLSLTLDFHFSDTWADPAHQTKPAAWNSLQFAPLTDSIRQYTRNVIAQLKSQNTLPDYIQIGNEISCGMLWNDGNVCNPDSPEQWNKLGILIKNAIQGVNEAISDNDEVKIIIHFANGANNGACRWFYDNIKEENIQYDIIGLSYYPWWHGTFTDLKNNMNDLASRYNKDIVVVESGYPWTLAWNDNTNNIVGSASQLLDGYPATVDGQYNYLKDLIALVKEVEGNHGKGIIYWSPEWIAAPGWGSPWENVALFDFDNNVLTSIKAFEDNIGTIENEAKQQVSFKISPNPVRQSAKIILENNQTQLVELTISDLRGNSYKSLYIGKLETGVHDIPANLEDLPAGIYFIQLKTETTSAIEKIILLD